MYVLDIILDALQNDTERNDENMQRLFDYINNGDLDRDIANRPFLAKVLANMVAKRVVMRDHVLNMPIVVELARRFFKYLRPDNVNFYATKRAFPKESSEFRELYLDFGNLDPIHINIDRWISFAANDSERQLYREIKKVFENGDY